MIVMLDGFDQVFPRDPARVYASDRHYGHRGKDKTDQQSYPQISFASGFVICRVRRDRDGLQWLAFSIPHL